MKVFEFTQYTDFIREFIASQPSKGRGQVVKIANHLGVNATFISQVLGGYKDLNQEQAFLVGEYMGLIEIEMEYFLTLILLAKAGSYKLKNHYNLKLSKIKKEGLNLKYLVQVNKNLSDEEKSIFYSSWIYSAICLYCTLGDGKSLEEITSHFEIERSQISKIINFLISTDLLRIHKNLYVAGARSTHIDRESPHLIKHHTNWRIKSLNAAEQIMDDEMMFTSPISLSLNDFLKVREVLSTSIRQISKIVNASEAETIACLNIDLFKI